MLTLARDEIFRCVSVCRTFQLSGLQEILRRTHYPIEPVHILWYIGDLSAGDYLRFQTNWDYIVNHKKAREVIKDLDDPSSADLHEAWRGWHREEFENKRKFEDLAELLYHETAYFYFKTCSRKGNGIVDYLKKKAKEYLEFYVESEQLKDKPKEIRDYMQKLLRQLQREELNRFSWFLTESQFEMFIDFINSLDFSS